ncbi:MAG: hypothetical protein ABI178_10415 [Rhodanobacter sp.]
MSSISEHRGFEEAPTCKEMARIEFDSDRSSKLGYLLWKQVIFANMISAEHRQGCSDMCGFERTSIRQFRIVPYQCVKRPARDHDGVHFRLIRV